MKEAQVLETEKGGKEVRERKEMGRK
jgi:hypothetical protein